MTITTVELLARLNARPQTYVDDPDTTFLVNPDGPEAATLISNLVKALEPFAAMADWLDDTEKRRDAIHCGGPIGLRCQITQADYHRARSALRSNLDKEEGDTPSVASPSQEQM